MTEPGRVTVICSSSKIRYQLIVITYICF